MSEADNTSGSETERQVLALNAFLPYQLNQLAETVSRSFSRIYADQFGIGIPEWRVLAIVGERGRVTAKEIGIASAMHKTKVSRAISALETKGILERGPNPDDLREHFVKLTGAGARIYERLIPQALDFSSALRNALTADQQAMLDEIFERLIRASAEQPSTGKSAEVNRS